MVDIQNNHPNDLVAIALFSRPVFGNDPAGIGGSIVPQYSLTNNYASMITSLWVPPGSGGFPGDVKLFGDPNAVTIPSPTPTLTPTRPAASASCRPSISSAATAAPSWAYRAWTDRPPRR